MDELIARLEKATGPDRELDADIMYFEIERGAGIKVARIPSLTETANHYTLSIDAAITLVPEEHNADVIRFSNSKGHANVKQHMTEAGHLGNGATPAIALCIAALKARKALTASKRAEEG